MVPTAPRTRPLPRLRALPRPWRTDRTRWTAWSLVAGGAALVPWMGVLAVRLPETAQVSNWAVAWIGLDAVIAAGLVSTGVLLARGDNRHTLTAAATAGLLVMDAWFDVATAGEDGRALAIALALGAGLPAAAQCALVAVRGLEGTPAARGDRECKETDETW
ncbi:hypothetical protein [Spirillospora sp. NPDC029432]|uniref:hypothetical protein n=1 Tax=Spirillospora sp. NPDC029432 TaxID=3154599 RepID=UPI003453361B